MRTIKTPSFELAIYTAGDPDAKKLALCLPGYCDTKDYPDIHSHADLLGARGYYAVAFDPPGTWDSPGGIALYTTTNYLQAINELIAHFGNRPTLLLGKSMGGRLAQLAAPHPAVIAYISVVGHADAPIDSQDPAGWPNNPRRTPHRDPPGDPAHFRDFVIPFSFAEDAFRHNAMDVISAITVPKLYIAGEEDVLVPPARLRRAYDAAAEPKQFVVLPMDHDYRKDPAKLQLVNDAIARWLDDNQL